MPFAQIPEMIKVQWARTATQAEVAELERSLLSRRRATNETKISMEIMWGTENLYAHSPVNPSAYDPTSAVGPCTVGGPPPAASPGKRRAAA